ncbi:MAG: hypothetical protein ACOYL3_28325 [Desulfuromonadaceae bacterium]
MFSPGSDVTAASFPRLVDLTEEYIKIAARLPAWTEYQACCLVLGKFPADAVNANSSSQGSDTEFGQKWYELIQYVELAIISGDLHPTYKSVQNHQEKYYRPFDFVDWVLKLKLAEIDLLHSAVKNVNEGNLSEYRIITAGDKKEADNDSKSAVDEDSLYISNWITSQHRDNPGAQGLWEPRDYIIVHAALFMHKIVTLTDCKCRHDKLAKIAYEYATDKDNKKLKDFDSDRFSLLDAFKEAALKIVPEERLFGFDTYDPEKNKCGIQDHKKI